MRFPIFTLTLACIGLMAGVVQAQTATGGNVESQQTWTTLSDNIKVANDKTNAVSLRIDQQTLCGQKDMLYAPGEAGIDSQGCKLPPMPPTVTTTINNAVTNVNNSASNLNNIINCNDTGKIYNAGLKACQSIIQASSIKMIGGSGNGGQEAFAACPAGTSLISCAGSRDPSYSDDGGEENHKFYGAGPINATTCKSASRNGHPIVYAFCL